MVEPYQPLEWAAILFRRVFQEAYQENLGRGPHWFFRPFSEERAKELGLTLLQLNTGLQVLREKGLVESKGINNSQLTDLGRSVCLHPETLEDELRPPTGFIKLNSLVFNGPMQNTQIGDGNVQNVTYSTVLQSLIEKIEKDPDLDKEAKSRWVEVLKDIAVSAVGQTIIAAGTAAAAML